MSRTRKITTNDILDAAERVIVHEGAAGLSIDAVAKEAGVSKSRVVYDHKNKSALLEALIERRMAEDVTRVRASVEANADTPHPELFGRIAVLETTVNDADRAVALAVSASMPSEDKLQERMRQWVREDLDAMASGPKPRAALMAYLASIGFYYTELFDFHRWSSGEREQILEEFKDIYKTFPDRT